MAFSKQVDVFASEPSNQVPSFAGPHLFEADPLLQALTSDMPGLLRQNFQNHGEQLGSVDSFQLARLATEKAPIFKSHDENGRRIDRVEFHPSYHALMRRSVAAGLQGSVWEDAGANEDGNHHHLARAIRYYMSAQVESGHLSSLSATCAAAAPLRHTAQLVQEWLPRIRSRNYDNSAKAAHLKTGVTIGYATTEKQSGSNLRATITKAERAGADYWRITGHKWFVSAPMSDAFLTLAQTDSGLSCFLVPRYLPDGALNPIRLQRLKQMVGGNVSGVAEMEFHGALGRLVGRIGEGSAVIGEMLALTRVDSALANAGMARNVLARTVHHTRYRGVAAGRLIDQPIMLRVLADMALDSAASTVLALRLAEAYDRGLHDPNEAAFFRLMTPVTKYWVTKSTAPMIAECMDCIGGNALSEDWPIAQLYREAPVGSMWEGSGNQMALEVLRVLRGAPGTLEIVLGTVGAVFGHEHASLLDVVRAAGRTALQDEGAARIITEQLALTVAAAELRRIARQDISDAFIETRLASPWRTTYGMLDGRFDTRYFIDAMFPPMG